MKLIDFIDKMRVYQSSHMTIKEWCKSALVAGKAIDGLYDELELYGCETTNGVPSEKWLKYLYATDKLYGYIDANAENIINLTMEEVTKLYRDVLKSACKMYSPEKAGKTMEDEFVEKYGDKEVDLRHPILTIEDNYASAFSSGSNGYITAVRVKNNKFEYYHDWWSYGWLTIEEIREDYPHIVSKLRSGIMDLLYPEKEKSLCEKCDDCAWHDCCI